MQPLADITVLDLTWHLAGPYATRLLGDYGADVIKVERPGAGDPARAYGPFPNDEPHQERSGTFLHLNPNKRSVTVNLKDEAGKRIIRELTAQADVVVESFSPGVLDRLGLGYEELRRVNPSLVMCSITSYGQTGPYRDWKATEFTLAAHAGLTYTTGIQEKGPLKHTDHLQEYQGGAMGAMAIMGQIRNRRRHGVGDHIDIAIYQVASDSADRRKTYVTGYAYTGLVARREISTPTSLPIGICPCKDGWVYIVASPTSRWRRFMDMLGRRDLWEDPQLQDPDFWSRWESKEFVDSLLYPWLMERTRQEVMEAAQRARVPVTAVSQVSDVFRDPHFRERGYFIEAVHPEAGPLPYAGGAIRKGGEGFRLRSTAPLLGQHNEDVLTGRLGFSPAELVLLRETGAI